MIRILYYFIMWVASMFTTAAGGAHLMGYPVFTDEINKPLIPIVITVLGLISATRYFALIIDQDNKLNTKF